MAAFAAAATALGLSTPSMAVIIAPTLDGTTLINTLLAGGGAGIDLSTVTVTTFSGHQNGSTLSAGTFTDAEGSYGLAPGIVLSSGSVNAFGTSSNFNFGTLATAPQQSLLGPISGIGSHFDVTQLTVTFDMLPGFDTVFFNVTFQSTEFPNFIGSSFVDAFGLFVNGTNIAFVAGDPINIDHPFMGTDPFFAGPGGSGVLGSVATGSTQGAGLPAQGPFFHTFSSAAMATGNVLTFIIADSGDSALDSFAFISQLGGSLPPMPPSSVPTPGTIALLGAGLAGIGLLRRRREEG